MRMSHRVRTSATPAQVWAVLGEPTRWPECDPLLRSVRGSAGRVSTGQHLLGVGRGLAARIPIDVVEAVPERRLVLRVHAALGVVEQITAEITPAAGGGCHLGVTVVVDGLFARVAAVPAWLANGITSRVLVRRVETLVRAGAAA